MSGAPRRVLFVLRGKLGDSVVSYASARAYADAFPQDEVALLVRANYAPLFAGEKGLRVIGFPGRLAMYLRLAWMRVAEPAWDALVVLLGSGRPVERLGRLVRAKRKVFLDARLAHVYPEWPQIRHHHLQPEPAWCAVRMIAPELPMPGASSIPSLAARRSAAPAAVGLVPVSDEARRTMSVDVVHALVKHARARHPGLEVRILVNREDREAQALLAQGAPEGAAYRDFPTMQALVDELAQLAHLYTTDTGLYHLACAMGVPVTVFYGPTQPWKNGFPRQPGLERVRIAALGGEHCDEKGCRRPACLDGAVAGYVGAAAGATVDESPDACLLRRFDRAAVAAVEARTGEAPDSPGGRC